MARQSRVPCLLLTRPAPQSQRFAQEIRARLGAVPVVISPLMTTVFHRPDLPDLPFRAVILTSETGVKATSQLHAALPALAFCVGNRTAAAATAAGFDARSADGDVHALAAMILASGVAGPLLHLRGEDSAGNLAETLTKGGIETYSTIIYTQAPCPLTDQALALFGQDTPVLAPVFSPRSARLLVAALPPTRVAPVWVAAISPAAAEAARALSPARLVTAAHPDGENMLHAVADLYSLPGTA